MDKYPNTDSPDDHSGSPPSQEEVTELHQAVQEISLLPESPELHSLLDTHNYSREANFIYSAKSDNGPGIAYADIAILIANGGWNLEGQVQYGQITKYLSTHNHQVIADVESNRTGDTKKQLISLAYIYNLLLAISLQERHQKNLHTNSGDTSVCSIEQLYQRTANTGLSAGQSSTRNVSYISTESISLVAERLQHTAPGGKVLNCDLLLRQDLSDQGASTDRSRAPGREVSLLIYKDPEKEILQTSAYNTRRSEQQFEQLRTSTGRSFSPASTKYESYEVLPNGQTGATSVGYARACKEWLGTYQQMLDNLAT